jgi:hypothetical protein
MQLEVPRPTFLRIVQSDDGRTEGQYTTREGLHRSCRRCSWPTESDAKPQYRRSRMKRGLVAMYRIDLRVAQTRCDVFHQSVGTAPGALRPLYPCETAAARLTRLKRRVGGRCSWLETPSRCCERVGLTTAALALLHGHAWSFASRVLSRDAMARSGPRGCCSSPAIDSGSAACIHVAALASARVCSPPFSSGPGSSATDCADGRGWCPCRASPRSHGQIATVRSRHRYPPCHGPDRSSASLSGQTVDSHPRQFVVECRLLRAHAPAHAFFPIQAFWADAKAPALQSSPAAPGLS